MTTLRIASDCPKCGEPMAVRKNRAKGDLFLGCTGYPRCRFTEQFEPRLAQLASRVHALELEMARLQPGVQRQGPVSDDDLRRLIFLAHPDKWPGNPLAHELAVAINAMRERKVTRKRR